jgi:hypothetical protein
MDKIKSLIEAMIANPHETVYAVATLVIGLLILTILMLLWEQRRNGRASRDFAQSVEDALRNSDDDLGLAVRIRGLLTARKFQ